MIDRVVVVGHGAITCLGPHIAGLYAVLKAVDPNFGVDGLSQYTRRRTEHRMRIQAGQFFLEAAFRSSDRCEGLDQS